MAKMVMEKITRWKCSACGYITFIKPYKGDCPACSFGKDIVYDLRPEENEEND
jgi:rubrerythrin